MPPTASPTQTPCPVCNPGGSHPLTAGQVTDGTTKQVVTCPFCDGSGTDPRAASAADGFPTFFWYPFGPFSIGPNGAGFPSGLIQKQIANEADYDLVFLVVDILQGDPRFGQLKLTDVGSNFDYSSDFVDINLFAGSGQLPLPILIPYTFGRNTQLRVTGQAITLPGQTQVIGVGNAVLTSFTGVLQTPVLPGPPAPGQVSVTVTAGAIVGTDDGNGAIVGVGVTGTVDYVHGTITVNYAAAPALNVKVIVTFTLGNKTIVLQVALFGFSYVGRQGLGSGQPAPVAAGPVSG